MAFLARNDVFEQLQQIFPNHGRNRIELIMVDEGVDDMNIPPDIMNKCIDRLMEIEPTKEESDLKDNDWDMLNDVEKKVAVQLKQIFPNFSNNVIKASVQKQAISMGFVASEDIVQICINDLLEGETALDDAPILVKEQENKAERKGNSKSGNRAKRSGSVRSAVANKYREVPQFDSDDDSELMTALEETETLVTSPSCQVNDSKVSSTNSSKDCENTATQIKKDNSLEMDARNNNHYFEKRTTVYNSGNEDKDVLISNGAVSSKCNSTVSSCNTSLQGNEDKDVLISNGAVSSKCNSTVSSCNTSLQGASTVELACGQSLLRDSDNIEDTNEQGSEPGKVNQIKPETMIKAAETKSSKEEISAVAGETNLKHKILERPSDEFKKYFLHKMRAMDEQLKTIQDLGEDKNETIENKEGRQLLPGCSIKTKNDAKTSSIKNVLPAATSSLLNSSQIEGDISRKKNEENQDSYPERVENAEKLVNSKGTLDPSDTCTTESHQQTKDNFQSYRDKCVKFKAYKVPRLDGNYSADIPLKAPSTHQSAHNVQADVDGSDSKDGNDNFMKLENSVKHHDLSYQAESSVDKVPKNVFQEYRTPEKKARGPTPDFSSDSNSDKDMLMDKSAENSNLESNLMSPSKERDISSSGYNGRKRRYMLLDFSSDSDSDDGIAKDISARKSNEDQLPDISFRSNNRQTVLSPASKWKHDRRESRDVTAAISGKLAWRSPRNDDEQDQKYQPNNEHPPILPHSRFVAAGTVLNSSRDMRNDMFTNAQQKENADGFSQNKPTTVLIESTTKITYSPHSYRHGLGNQEGEPIPTLVTHSPAFKISFPKSSKNETKLYSQDSMSATSTSLYRNNLNSNNGQPPSTMTRHAPVKTNNQQGSRPVYLPSISRRIASDLLAGPRTRPMLNSHEYNGINNRFVPHTIPYSATSTDSFSSSTINLDASTSQSSKAGSKTLNSEEKAAVPTSGKATATVTEPVGVIQLSGNSEETGVDDGIEVTLFEPANQIHVPDSPENNRQILDINPEPLVIDDVAVRRVTDDVIVPHMANEVVIPHAPDENVIPLIGNENGHPLLAAEARDRSAMAADQDAGLDEVMVTEVETKSPQQVKEELKNDVLKFFPDLDPQYLEQLCQMHTGIMALNNICFILLENDYPRVQQKGASESTEPKKISTVDYFKHNQFLTLDNRAQRAYAGEAHLLLINQFPMISAADIRKMFNLFKNSYALTYRVLHTVFKNAVEKVKKDTEEGKKTTLKGLVFNTTIELDSSQSSMTFRLLKTRRPTNSIVPTLSTLMAEVEFVKVKMNELATEEDHQFALQLNEQEYEEEGQCIECGCCYGEIPFDNMVQCLDGHLFCEDCLRQYAKESVFGQGKAQLLCMTEGCKSAFPKNQLEKALSSEVLMRYEDRVAEENLNLADIGDLVRCPHCDYAAIMDPNDRVFTCMNEKCNKATCRHCKEDWSEHFGKSCEEIEKKDEVKLRLEYEEKMTKAKVRTCHRCKAQFTKEDGCNKMTCRCGGKMCYICRKPNIDYNHFCQHPRDPGKICALCQACSLWTNPEEDDNRAVLEIQKEAAEVRKNKGFSDEKVIGVPEQPSKKRKH